MKVIALIFAAAVGLAGCSAAREVRGREQVGRVDGISGICGPKQQLLNEERVSLVFVQIVNEEYAFYYRGNSEGMKEINCAYPFEVGELEAWLTANKIQYGKYVFDPQ